MKHGPQALGATKQPISASFRDPAGFIFRGPKGQILRQVNKAGKDDYKQLQSSGLYDALVEKGMLVPHTDVGPSMALSKDAYTVIEPTQVPYITYPYEWSFSQLQDAALLTLAIQKIALQHGMSLKDASAYNIQFLNGRPIFIDTLSFEVYEQGKPWQAYRQFCQHFLAPLTLMTYNDPSWSQLLRVHLDGIPLPLAVKALPRRVKARPSIAMHLVLHAKAQQAKASEHKQQSRPVSKQSLEAIIGSLERLVAKLKSRQESTEWGDYYNNTNYTADAADEKARIITDFLTPHKIKNLIDLGGNNGKYSRVANAMGIETICTDIDPNAVDANYRFVKKHGETKMLPLLVDLTNPGGGLGWANEERDVLHHRIHADAVMALALIHHLAISNNLPLEKIARYFSSLGTYAVIEFVPKQDSQVQKLLSTRKDIFPDYTENGLKRSFGEHFELLKEVKIAGSERTLYLFKRK